MKSHCEIVMPALIHNAKVWFLVAVAIWTCSCGGINKPGIPLRTATEGNPFRNVNTNAICGIKIGQLGEGNDNNGFARLSIQGEIRDAAECQKMFEHFCQVEFKSEKEFSGWFLPYYLVFVDRSGVPIAACRCSDNLFARCDVSFNKNTKRYFVGSVWSVNGATSSRGKISGLQQTVSELSGFEVP